MQITHNTYETQTADSSESHQRIYDFLSSHPTGVLAVTDADGNPHATVIYFSLDKHFNFSFTTKNDTKKHDVLRHNNHLMLVVYEPLSQTTVQITGIAEDATETPDATKIFKDTYEAAVKTSESGIPPISKLYAGHYVAYKIKPVQIRMAVFARPDPGGYDVYETIDFES